MYSIDTKPLGARIAGATFAGTMLFAAPLFTPTSDLAFAASKQKAAPADDVESRIKTLRSQLKITPEQEAAWNDVAQAMRDNAKVMVDLRQQQDEAIDTATAPQMIDTYGKTMETHAENIQKFSDVFQKLYNGMSDAQKKTADAVFRERVEKAAAKQRSKS
jgi:protein CpxP